MAAELPPPGEAADATDGDQPASATTADSDELAKPSTQWYQGAFWGLQVHTGLQVRTEAPDGESGGMAFGVSARVATIMTILDLQASVFGSAYEAQTRAGHGADIGRWSIGVEARGHPFFMTMLRNNRFWYSLAGIYGSIGVDLDITTVGSDRTEADLGWHIGSGIDIPLTDPNTGQSLWLGFGYKLRFLTVDTGIPGLGEFDEHQLLLTLGYRNNDLLFGRIERPSAMDYRNPSWAPVE